MKKAAALILLFVVTVGCLVTGQTTATPPAPTIPPPLPTGTNTAAADSPGSTPAQVISPENAARLEEIGALAMESPYRLFFSPDSRRAFAVSRFLTVGFNLPGLKEESRLPVAEQDILLAVSPAANLAALTGDHQTLRLVDLQTGQAVRSIQMAAQFTDAFFSPDGSSLGLISADEIRVDLLNTSDGSLLRQYRGFQTAAPVYNVLPAGDGKNLAWISRSRLQLMDFASGQIGPEFAHEDFIAGWALSPDGGLLATSAGGELDGEFFPLIYLWDARSGIKTAVIKLTEAPAASLAFTPDGRILAAADGSGVRLYRVSDRSLIAGLKGPTDRISFLAFSPDGRSLLASAGDNLVHLWQVVP